MTEPRAILTTEEYARELDIVYVDTGLPTERASAAVDKLTAHDAALRALLARCVEAVAAAVDGEPPGTADHADYASLLTDIKAALGGKA